MFQRKKTKAKCILYLASWQHYKRNVYGNDGNSKAQRNDDVADVIEEHEMRINEFGL